MEQKDKELLLKDLCARLPYGVMVYDNSHGSYGESKLINIGIDGSMLIDNENNDIQYYPIISEVKPYLRPLESMTEEEKKEYDKLLFWKSQIKVFESDLKVFDWLNSHHFDYRGLIEKGLALEAPEGMYKKF